MSSLPQTEETGRVPAGEIEAVLRRYWGYSSLRPLQEEAIRLGLARRDSLVVLPTGGGKSLCYQIPAALAGGTDVVISPLIALMKDQVDGLRDCGYPAAALYSGLSIPEQREIEQGLVAGQYRLLFVAPERLLTPRFLDLLNRVQVRAFAIDEAHCISHWGHDFRPEYRQLAQLKQRFPHTSMHAFTATATERVRGDIVEQLKLRDATVLVGTFDRPNLVYRIVPRVDVQAQVVQALKRHSGEAAIVYCISRKDAESMAENLIVHGIRAAHYHAGMDADARRRAQDKFANEQIDVVCATVAFGMGIDRSDVRCVIHAAMPKSIEHYQQETGRAGRDGLEAECVLFYSSADPMRWERLFEKSAAETEVPAEIQEATRELLWQMRRFCNSAQCRHRLLSEYFGQAYPAEDCKACDVCLSEVEGVADGTVTAQKILSCVARAGERFGAEHIVDVLVGADTERVRRWNHEKLSTYRLLDGTPRKTVSNYVYQLIDAGLLARSDGDRPTLRLTPASWEVMRNQRSVRLVQPVAQVKAAPVDTESWEGVDRGLFDSLRDLRRKIAEERGVPPYVVFSDATLRELARVRPGSPETFINVRGIGQRKLAELGPRFLEQIAMYCAMNDLALDAALGSRPRSKLGPSTPTPRPSAAKLKALELFAEGRSLEDVAAAVERTPITVCDYLEEYIASARPADIGVWVDGATQRLVEEAVQACGGERLKPIFEHLGGNVSYLVIRVVLAHAKADGGSRDKAV